MDLDPAFLQTRILKFFGFFPLTDRKAPERRVLQIILTSIGSCLLLGNCACCCLQVVWTVAILLIDSGGNLLLKIFVVLPLLTDTARPLLVLFILFIQRGKWNQFYQNVSRFSSSAFPDLNLRRRLLQKWRLYSVLLFLGTCVVQQVTFFWSQHTVFSISPSMNYTTDNALSPFQTKLTVWKMSVIWFTFPVTTLILSQQVMVMVMLLCLALAESLRCLNKSIDKAKENYLVVSGKNWNYFSEEIADWKKRNWDCLAFSEMLNGRFSWILFFIYGLNFITVLGYGANIVMNLRPAWDSYGFYGFACVLYCVFNTAFFVPLVSVYEQSLEVSSNMQQLINASEQYFQETKQGRILLGSMVQFEAASRHHVCLLSGAKLLYFSRGFVVGTGTLAFSLMVVAKELLDSELRGNPEAGQNMVNSVYQQNLSTSQPL